MAGFSPDNPRHSHNPMENGRQAFVFITVILVVMAMLAANASQPRRVSWADQTATVAAGQFHAQLTLGAAEGDCLPMPCEKTELEE